MTSHIRIPQHVYAKSAFLLPMMYKIGEIADELDVPLSTLKGWLRHGAPHQRDSRNHIFVNGEEFSKWVISILNERRPRNILQENEAYCLKCRKPTQIHNPKSSMVGGTQLLQGTCPICKSTVNKGIRNDQ